MGRIACIRCAKQNKHCITTGEPPCEECSRYGYVCRLNKRLLFVTSEETNETTDASSSNATTVKPKRKTIRLGEPPLHVSKWHWENVPLLDYPSETKYTKTKIPFMDEPSRIYKSPADAFSKSNDNIEFQREFPRTFRRGEAARQLSQFSCLVKDWAETRLPSEQQVSTGGTKEPDLRFKRMALPSSVEFIPPFFTI